MSPRVLNSYARVALLASVPFWLGAFAFAQCSGNQAPPEMTNGNPPQPVYVPQGQHFHLNVAALSNYTSSQAADLINGITAWAGVNGISFDYVSAPPGPGVITVQPGSNLGSIGLGNFFYGGSGAAANQITGGLIQIDLNYVSPNGATGPFSAYDANQPNADTYLTGIGAHEMGHVLGLNDTADAGQANQTSTSVMGGSLGTNNNGDAGSKPAPTSNTPTDCDKATVGAQAAANSGSGGGGGGSTGTGGGDGSGSGGSSGDGGGGGCGGYTEWDDSTNTLTYYGYC